MKIDYIKNVRNLKAFRNYYTHRPVSAVSGEALSQIGKNAPIRNHINDRKKCELDNGRLF